MSKASWKVALAATLGMQIASSFMGQAIPTVGPLLTEATGLSQEQIGNVNAVAYGGNLIFLLFFMPILARFGPVRTLQLSGIAAAVAMLIATTGWLPALMLAAVLQGFSYGPSAPAGSRIIAETAPIRHRTLIFSIKQSGVPFGGVLAGLILAPIGHWAGYRPAMIFAAICGILAAIAIEPTRRMLDAERDRSVSVSPRALLRWSNLTSSIRAITQYPGLLPVTFMALSLSVIQGSLFTFTVTYLVARGLDLAEAGTALACLQIAGVTGRIVLGWLADRTGKPIRNLVLQSFAGALFTVFFGLIPNGTSLLLAGALAALTGFVSAGWNGIFLSEIARLSPPDRVAEATSAANVVIFLGYASSPAIFTALIAWTGSWTIPFMLFAGQLALMGTVQGVMLLTGRHPSVNLRRA